MMAVLDQSQLFVWNEIEAVLVVVAAVVVVENVDCCYGFLNCSSHILGL